MTNLKDDAKDSTLHFGTKSHELYLSNFTLHLEMLEKAIPFSQKLEK